MLNMDSLSEANSGLDLYNLEKLKTVNPFDDSMLIQYQFDRDYYHKYYSDDEFKRNGRASKRTSTNERKS